LKRELLRIPLWGQFLAKVEPIAIDRSQGKESMEQIIAGAKRVQAQGRPIIIFPQGTRISPSKKVSERPYKIGAARMALETELPLVPMALNSGMFWPRNSWLKRPGKVVFEFLPPISLASRDVAAITRDLEARLEKASDTLHKEAAEAYGISLGTSP
ncbi:MAG TPA: lysophospholipid acyltransferase family protein, partial [Patescibacteria group bacterium]|nr:lysophospholipid acyltransferase family protein [Patescibacteria group bacterium]